MEEVVDLQPAGSEENEQEINNNNFGGRWYECVFCKRGFNTAQALGGHMNIHRKDRAKNNPTPSISSSSSSSSTMVKCYIGPRIYQPILHGGYPSPPPPPPPQLLISPNLGGSELCYPGYFPDQYCNNNNNGRAGSYPYVGDDWSMKLRLELGSASAVGGMAQDYHMERKGERNHKELDLELRLGPGP